MAVPRELEQGLAAHRARQWDRAEKHYRRAAKEPALRGDALHLLGSLYMDQGRQQDALPILARAVDLAPQILAYRLTKARCEYQLGQFQAALFSLSAVPAQAVVDSQTRQHLADGLTAVGLGLRDSEGAVAALPAFRGALALRPGHPGLLRNLGMSLVAAGVAEEAVPILNAARAVAPQDRELWLALSEALLEANRSDEAEDLLRDACRNFPDDVRFVGNLATLLQEHDRLEEALTLSERVLANGAPSGRRLFNHANILYGLGRWQEAIGAYDDALSGGYDSISVLFNRAKARLTADASSLQGWSDYLCRHLPPLPSGCPLPLRPPTALQSGQKICLLPEQGPGDQLFFLRWVPLLLALGIEVALALDGKLKGLLRQSVDLPWFDDPRHAVEAGFATPVWLGDLPILAQSGQAKVAVPPPFPLQCRKDGTEQPDLRAITGCARLIGFTWRAGQLGRNRLSKQAPFDSLLDILASMRSGIICLQRSPAMEEMEQLRERLGDRLVDCSALNDSLGDMAAVLSTLDAYVTVSNTNLHIAESLGQVRSFVLVPRPYFTWGTNGDSSPWFPNSRVLRRPSGAGWDATVQSLSQAIGSGVLGTAD